MVWGESQPIQSVWPNISFYFTTSQIGGNVLETATRAETQLILILAEPETEDKEKFYAGFQKHFQAAADKRLVELSTSANENESEDENENQSQNQSEDENENQSTNESEVQDEVSISANENQNENENESESKCNSCCVIS